MDSRWQLMYDRAAGQTRIVECNDDYPRQRQQGHFNEIGIYPTRQEAEAAEVELAGPDIWCVFFDRAAWQGFITAENGTSGNWRGSKHGYYNLVAEYSEAEYPDAKSRANQHLREMLAG